MPTPEQIQQANQEEWDNLKEVIRQKDDIIRSKNKVIEAQGRQITEYQDKLDEIQNVIKNFKLDLRHDDECPY